MSKVETAVITQADVETAKAEFSTLWSKYLEMTRNQSAHTKDQVVAAYDVALAAQARANDLASRVGQAAPVIAKQVEQVAPVVVQPAAAVVTPEAEPTPADAQTLEKAAPLTPDQEVDDWLDAEDVG